MISCRCIAIWCSDLLHGMITNFPRLVMAEKTSAISFNLRKDNEFVTLTAKMISALRRVVEVQSWNGGELGPLDREYYCKRYSIAVLLVNLVREFLEHSVSARRFELCTDIGGMLRRMPLHRAFRMRHAFRLIISWEACRFYMVRSGNIHDSDTGYSVLDCIEILEEVTGQNRTLIDAAVHWTIPRSRMIGAQNTRRQNGRRTLGLVSVWRVESLECVIGRSVVMRIVPMRDYSA